MVSKQKTVTQKKKETAQKKAKAKKLAWNKKVVMSKKKAKVVKTKKLRLAKAKKIKIAKIAKAKKVRLAKKKSAAPHKRVVKSKTSKKVLVKTLLTRKDEKFMIENGLAQISIKIDGETFLVSKNHSVPTTAKINRDGQGQVTGMRAVTSG